MKTAIFSVLIAQNRQKLITFALKLDCARGTKNHRDSGDHFEIIDSLDLWSLS